MVYLNFIKLTVLLVLSTLLLIWLGAATWGVGGAIGGLLIGLLGSAILYWLSDKIVLWYFRAKRITISEAPEIYQLVMDITQKLDLPTPKLYIIPQVGANLLAVGRGPRHVRLALSQGILHLLKENQMKTLIAYQLFLAKQNDTQLGAAVASILLPFLSLPNWLRRKLGLNRAESSTKNTAMLLFSKALDALFFVPCSLLLQVFFYKGRISGVDFQVVKLMHTNRDMIEALQRLGQYQEEFPFYCGPEMAHLLVISPLQEAFPCQLLITHPPLSERIARLERLKV